MAFLDCCLWAVRCSLTLAYLLLPPLSYFFLAASSSVKIHSRTTGQVVSTLSAVGAPSSSGTQKGIDEAHTAAITGMLINPQNPLQLITASLDGTIKIWDFLDAVLLKSIAIGYPVTHVCAHADSKGHVFVAVRKPSQGAKTAPGSQGADPLFDAGECRIRLLRD